MTSIVDMIAHYQRSIEKSENDRKRLLHCISVLYKLPVTVQHLQDTGIGRTVNALRKDDDEVGVAAKALVTKWKAMVAAEESSEGEAEVSDDIASNDDHSSSRHKKSRRDHHHHRDSSDDQLRKEHKNHHSSRSSSRSKKDKSESSLDRKIHHHQSIEKENRHKTHHKSNHTENRLEGNGNSVNGTDEDDEDESRLVIDISKEKCDVKRENDRHSHSKSDKHQHHRSSDSDRKSNSKSTAVDEKHSSSSKSKHRDNLSHSNSKDEEKECKSSSKESTRSHSASKDDKHKSSKSSSSDRKKDRRDDSQPSSSKSHSSSSGKSHKSNKEHRDDKSKEKSDKCDTNSSKNEKKSKDDSSSSGSSKRKSESAEMGSKTKKSKVAASTIESIDSSMGTSFADALGMIAPPKGKSSKSSSKNISVTPPTPTSSSSSISASASSSKSTPKEKQILTETPILLSPTIKLKPLEPDMAVELPKISNNYKPMPLNPVVMDCVFKSKLNSNSIAAPQLVKMMTDDEALGASFSSKNQRTKVFSGNKASITIIPTLHELCTRVLQKNIDGINTNFQFPIFSRSVAIAETALEFTGGVPFEILKPILERATTQQLLTFEHYNPYLVEDSDILWKEHCKRIFRSEKPREFESYREMFLRCRDEQEDRLNKFAVNMKKSQSVAVPAKKTKLAYVDSMVKPPRNIIKKQNQYGTERKLVATPAARVESLKNACSNAATVGDTRLKVLASIRDTAQAAAIPVRPKKAPLMQKSLQLMKGRFKR